MIERATKELKSQRGFNRDLQKKLFDTYNEVWADSEFVSVAENELHCIILDYVTSVFVAGINDERVLTLEKVSHSYEFTVYLYFKGEELFEGNECHEGYFLKLYNEKNGMSFTR